MIQYRHHNLAEAVLWLIGNHKLLRSATSNATEQLLVFDKVAPHEDRLVMVQVGHSEIQQALAQLILQRGVAVLVAELRLHPIDDLQDRDQRELDPVVRQVSGHTLHEQLAVRVPVPLQLRLGHVIRLEQQLWVQLKLFICSGPLWITLEQF